MKEVIRLRQKFPDSIVGLDIAGWEEAGHPLIYFLEALLYPSQHGIKLPYFFHSAETGMLSNYCALPIHVFKCVCTGCMYACIGPTCLRNSANNATQLTLSLSSDMLRPA